MHENDLEKAEARIVGNFGEYLACYALLVWGYEVVRADHVGADLIARNYAHQIAISVKARRYGECRLGDQDEDEESMAWICKDHELETLDRFAARFNLEPVCVHIAVEYRTNTIRFFMLRSSEIRSRLKRTKHGYRASYETNDDLEALTKLPTLNYMCWTSQISADNLFTSRNLTCNNEDTG